MDLDMEKTRESLYIDQMFVRMLFYLCVFVVRQMYAGQRGPRISLSYSQATGLKNLLYDKNAQMK